MLLAVWAAATGALTQSFYGNVPGRTKMLGVDHRVGQTFQAGHDGLSGVELQLFTYAAPADSSLVLHVRRSLTATQDLATALLPGQALVANAWQRYQFHFSPLPDSRGQDYYLQLEQRAAQAPANQAPVYWLLSLGDPYPAGQAFYDQAPLTGDVAFGLRYDPPLGAIWRNLRAAVLARIPLELRGILLAALALCPVLLGLLLWGASHGWFVARRALLGALLAGLALAHGLVYMIAMPPWQGPDEFEHYANTVLVATGISAGDKSPAAVETRQQIEQNILAALDASAFTQYTFLRDGSLGGPAVNFVNRPDYGTSLMFLETRQPPLYYRLAGYLLRAYGTDPPAVPPNSGLYYVRFLSVLLSVLVILLAYGCALLLAPGPAFRRLWLGLPLAIMLLPMHAFVDSIANNDVLAEVVVSLLVLVVIAWLKLPRPLSRRGLAAAGAGLLLVVLALFTKSTAALAAPLLWLVGLLAALFLQLQPLTRRAWGLLLAGALLALGAGTAVLWTGLDGATTAQSWLLSTRNPEPHLASATAHSGQYLLRLAPNHPVYQQLDLAPKHPTYRLTFQVWGRPAAPAQQARLALTVGAGSVPISTTGSLLVAPPGGSQWQMITAMAIITANTPVAYLFVRADGPVEVDDAALRITTAKGALVDTPLMALQNPSMEESSVQLRPDSLLARLLKLVSAGESKGLVDTLFNSPTFDKAAVIPPMLANEYRSYWGWFGWLTTPLQLPPAQYVLWLIVGLAALAGWVGGWIKRRRLGSSTWAPLLITLVTLGISEVATLLRTLENWVSYNQHYFPQGRYLFVLSIPTIWLLIRGLSQAGALARPARPVRAAALSAIWVPWLALNVLLYLDLYALLALLAPYYYGQF